MKRYLAILLLAATAAHADPAQTALLIAPDQVECIQETVWHDWASESAEVKQFYRDAHTASLLAAYAGVQAGIYDRIVVETAYAWYGCDWIQTLELVQRATQFKDVLTTPSRALTDLNFLGD